jgi:hypothetical protein
MRLLFLRLINGRMMILLKISRGKKEKASVGEGDSLLIY